MKPLKNWDNKTWLSSTKYLNNFYKFLKLKFKISNETKILDVGCGRANIISFLQKKYKFKNKATHSVTPAKMPINLFEEGVPFSSFRRPESQLIIFFIFRLDIFIELTLFKYISRNIVRIDE